MAKVEAARETEEKKKQEEKRKKEDEKKKRKSQSGGGGAPVPVVIPDAKSPKSPKTPTVPQSPRSPGIESPGVIPPPSPYKTPGRQESETQEAKVDMHAESEDNDVAYRGVSNRQPGVDNRQHGVDNRQHGVDNRQNEPPRTMTGGGITVTTPTRPQQPFPEQINRSSPRDTEPSITINGRTIPQERPMVLNGHIATGQQTHGQQVIMNSGSNRQTVPSQINQGQGQGHQIISQGQGHQRDSAGSSSQGSRRSEPRTPVTPVSSTSPVITPGNVPTSPSNGQRPTYQRAPSQESKRSSASSKVGIF